MIFELERKKLKIQISKRADDGTLLTRICRTFADDKDFNAGAFGLGLELETLTGFIDAFEKSGNPSGVYKHEESAKPFQGFTLYVRSIKKSEETSQEYSGETAKNCVQAAIADQVLAAIDQPYIYWPDKSQLCAIDLDVREGDEWTDLRLTSFLDHFTPCPAFAWVTHGKGLRLLYTNHGEFAAEEVAAIAYLHLSHSEPYRQLEFKYGTRHPSWPNAKQQSCGAVFERTQTFDQRVLARWLKIHDANSAEIQSWLESKGLEIGRRYDHEHCPISPSTSGGRQPVVINDSGIFCFVCEGAGQTIGNHRPGFFPYSHIIAESTTSFLRNCFENFSHWEHMRFIFDDKFRLKGRIAKLAYSASLKLYCGNPYDPRLKMVFNAGSNFIRLENKWTNLQGEAYTKDVKPIVERLPAAITVDTAGNPRSNPVLVSTLQQTFDLSQYGYPALIPLFGCKIYGHHMDYPRRDQTHIVLFNYELAHESNAKYRPRYIKKSARMDKSIAQSTLEEICPGVNWRLIYLLIAAKGIAEAGIGMPPIIFVTGPTSSGKSATVTLAAAICGDHNSEIAWTPDTDRVRMQVLNAREQGTYATFNEALKDADRAKRTTIQAMDFILNLTPDSTSHKLYVGPTRLGTLPVFVWTDTAIPQELQQDAQLARRIVHIHNSNSVDWAASIKDIGGKIQYLRTADIRYADAGNAILSEVIDDFFSERHTFFEVAERLQYSNLYTTPEAREMDDVLIAFYNALCATPSVTGVDAIRWKGRGWKTIHRSFESPLLQLWMQICDENMNGNFTSSRKCTEVDWQKLLGLPIPVEFQVKKNGNQQVALRFISSERTRVTYTVNEELRNAKTENN